MKRRLFSIFLALALCLSLLPAAAFAEGEDWVQPDFAFYTAPEASEETLIAENSWVCYYTLPTPGTVWLIVSEGFEWEPSELGVSDKKQLEWDGNTAKIVLSDPFDMDLDRYNLYAWSEDRDYKIIIEKNARCSAVNFEHDNGECVIGFIDRGSIADVHLTDMLGIPTAENGELVEWKQLEIGAIIRGESGESPADDVKFEVNSIKIRQLYGEDGAFSFSQHEVKLEAGTDKPTLYYREGVEAGALIMASLTITLPDGSEMQGTAEYAVALENYGLKFYTSSDLDDGSFVEMAARLNYYNIPEGAVWLHSDTPIDMESLQVTTFSSLAPVMETTLEWESVGEDNRTIKIKLLEPLTVVTDGSYLLSVKSSEGTAALTIHDGPTGMSVKLGDNEYIVGFVFDRAGQPAVNEGNNDSKFSIGGSTFGDPDPNGEREFFADATVGVGLKRRDASGVAYYTFSENCPISFEVTGFDIRYYNFGQETEGYEDTFSVTQNGDTFKIYNKVG